MTPLSLAQVKEIVETIDPEGEETKEIRGYIKKFTKLSIDESNKIEEEIQSLEIEKIKREHIVKIIDLLPEDASDLNKIFVDVSLDENEINKILEVVKNNK